MGRGCGTGRSCWNGYRMLERAKVWWEFGHRSIIQSERQGLHKWLTRLGRRGNGEREPFKLGSKRWKCVFAVWICLSFFYPLLCFSYFAQDLFINKWQKKSFSSYTQCGASVSAMPPAVVEEPPGAHFTFSPSPSWDAFLHLGSFLNPSLGCQFRQLGSPWDLLGAWKFAAVVIKPQAASSKSHIPRLVGISSKARVTQLSSQASSTWRSQAPR